MSGWLWILLGGDISAQRRMDIEFARFGADAVKRGYCAFPRFEFGVLRSRERRVKKRARTGNAIVVRWARGGRRTVGVKDKGSKPAIARTGLSSTLGGARPLLVELLRVS
ncbi:hypothetical protein B0H11DRAFT_2187362 [Mycena galericulata]|nr:hypothetical protein B0H11DRAFT_2187362 [Mycena galericulata]